MHITSFPFTLNFLPVFSSPVLLFLSSLLFSLSFKDETEGKCQLCSIWLHPQDICRHIQTRTGGAVIPVSAQTLLDHNPGKERSEKMRSAPIHPLIPLLVCSSRTSYFSSSGFYWEPPNMQQIFFFSLWMQILIKG